MGGSVLNRNGVKVGAAVITAVVALWPVATGSASNNVPVPVSPTNLVVSSPTSGGGYPEMPPVEGGCVGPSADNFNANHSESELAVQPDTEQIVGSSKFFFDKYSTGYNFYLGSYNINGLAHSNNIVQGYDCSTTGTNGALNQRMPPSWTNTTDPNVAFDTQGRVYQTVLPFNAFWTNLHPNGEITVSYSDNFGERWVTGNRGQALEQVPNSSSLQFGHVEDKQWTAVNHYAGNRFHDHVYSTWDIIDGNVGSTVKLRMAISRDRSVTRCFLRITTTSDAVHVAAARSNSSTGDVAAAPFPSTRIAGRPGAPPSKSSSSRQRTTTSRTLPATVSSPAAS